MCRVVKIALSCEQGVMKKCFLFFLMSLAIQIDLIAQDSSNNNNFISFTAGPSFPLGAFASNNSNRLNAGMANTGFTIEAKFAHQFDELFGISSAFVYASYPVDNHTSDGTSIKPWKYYEILIGPIMTGLITPKISLDLSVLSGTAFINASKVNVNSEVIKKKSPTSAVPLKLTLDFRFHCNRSFYLFTGVSYNYMRAHFNVTVESQELSFNQSMHTTGITAGVGFNFY